MDYPQAPSRASSHVALQQPHSSVATFTRVLLQMFALKCKREQRPLCHSWALEPFCLNGRAVPLGAPAEGRAAICCDASPERPPPAHSRPPESAAPSEGPPETGPWAAVWL